VSYPGGLKAGFFTATVGCLIAMIAASSAAAFQPLGQRGTGTAGDAAGQLNRPYQPAVDALGNLFVADSQNRRISEFAPDGSFIKAFGKDVGGTGVNVCTTSCQAGTDDGTAGSLCFPDGLAVDPVSGNLVVGDECAQAVMVFTPAGAFVKAFGKDVGGAGVDVCTSSCSTGTSGPDSGEFFTPVEIAIDGAGNVFVGEEDNDRIAVLTLSGGFQRAFGADVGGSGVDTCTSSCAAGTFGTAAGQLGGPSGVALDGAGHVLVGEESNDRVSVFTTSGTFVRAFGGNVGGSGVNVCTSSCVAGTHAMGAAGELFEPFEVGFDPATGEVLIPEFDGNRVSAYTPGGTFARTFGQDVDQGGGTGFEICTTLCQFGTSSTMPGSFDEPSGVTVDSAGTVYVSEDHNNRVQLLGEVPPAAKPSNAFSFGKLHRNKKKGTATLDVTVAGPGSLSASGKNASAKQVGAASSEAAAAASTVKLLIKAKGKARKKLDSTGKTKLNLLVTFTPTGGDPASQSKSVKLLKRP
jgi:DNA-binding beta-propeller fold protein YncE